MAYNKQELGRKGRNRQDNRGGGGFPNPNVKPYDGNRGCFPNPNAKQYDGNRERHMEASESFPKYEASKDNGVQGDQFSNDRSHQTFENTPRPPGSYPHEMRGNYRGRGRGQRNYDRDVQPGHYQSDSPKDNRNQGHGQQTQSGPNQGDSKKGDMAQRNSVKSGMDQGYRQEAKPDSYQAHSQESRGVVQDHGQGAEPISCQYPHEMRGNYRGRGRGQRNYDRDGSQQGHYYGDPKKVDNDQSVQPGPYQSDSPKDNRNQGHGQQAQSGPNQGDSKKGDMAQRNSVKNGMDQGYRQEAKPDSYQAHSQEGRAVVQDHGQGAEPISYQYPHEMRGNYRGRGRGQRNYDRDGSQQGHYYGDPKKVDNDQSVQPGPYQSDSLKDNRNQGHGQQAQSGPNQGDSKKGDMAQRNSVKCGMDQGYRQEAKPDSYQAHSQEGRGVVQDHGQVAEPILHQGHTQENIDRGQHDENDSRRGLQAVFDQKDTQKGTEGDRAQGLEQGIEPDSYKGDVSKIQPVFDQNVSQKGKEGDHVQGDEPSCKKGNLKEGNDLGQSHGNDSIQRTPSASHQKDLQKSINRGQSHEKYSGQWNTFGPNLERWRKGENSSRGHYQDNRTHSYQGQEGCYSRQSSSGCGSRRDNFDQQQRKRNRADDEDDIFVSKTLSFLLRHGAVKLNFKLMPGGFLYVDEILKKMQMLEGYTVENVQRIVAQNDKQTFAIQKEDGTGRLKIRANEGHTVEVEDLELTAIMSADQAPVVLHETYSDAWNSIKKQGLCRFKRNHIRFAAGEPGENGVISGMRSSCEILIYIDLEKALKDGLKFYLSANRVILSPGNEEGYIYPCYFSVVLNRYPYHILEFNPNIKGKTVSADQTSNELDKKTKKNKKKKKNKDRENNERKAPGEEVEGVGDTNLFADEEEKLKEENIEGKDEQDQFVDAMDTEPEKLTQIEVPDAWDDAEKVELDRKALINSKGAEQSEGTQGLAESEDPKETKESKTNEKDSWSETSKRASKSEAQSRSQAPKGATKPENSKGSVIQEGEQKAIKKGTFVPGDEDEEAPNGATEDEEDVKIEEEWTTVSITGVEESQSAVEYILEHKQNEPVSIICCGEKQGDADGKITLLVISMQNKSWIYQLCNMKPDLLDTGKLKQLFFDTDLMKVFHDVTWQSAVLFKQYEIVLDGTKVFDSKVVCQLKLLDGKTIDILRLEGFMPTRWVEEDGKIDNSKWTEISLDQELINKLVERCKALLQFYKMFTMQKVPQPRKEIFVKVNKYVDKKRSTEIKKNFKSQAEKTPPQPTSSSKEQTKGPASRKKKKKNKGK